MAQAPPAAAHDRPARPGRVPARGAAQVCCLLRLGLDREQSCCARHCSPARLVRAVCRRRGARRVGTRGPGALLARRRLAGEAPRCAAGRAAPQARARARGATVKYRFAHRSHGGVPAAGRAAAAMQRRAIGRRWPSRGARGAGGPAARIPGRGPARPIRCHAVAALLQRATALLQRCCYAFAALLQHF